MTINCRGKLLDFSIPKIMGILNVTPDSFFDGGKFNNETEVLKQAEKMLNEGVDLLDIGGMSSRPGAEIISEEEELKRVLPHILSIIHRFPDTVISVDTIHSKVAEESLNLGVHIINDISAGRYDANMISIVAKHHAPFILMHMKGLPADMQLLPRYENITAEVMRFLAERITVCQSAGIFDTIIDVGFGFGKNVEHNFTLLRNLKYFEQLNVPILAGVSRKAMICKVLDVSPANALNGTSVVNTMALMNGANLLRVHDVKEAKEAVKLFIAMKNS